MNHTVIMDQQETDKRFMNLINQAWRHCKIGKVTPKVVNPPWSGWNKGAAPAHQRFFDQFMDLNKPTYMPKCGCRVGSACGNAACPHMPIATATC